MITNSYLEYFLTLLGWVINNGIWGIITSTGLFALPLLFKLISIWLKVRGQGVDEGNKGALSLGLMENTIYVAMIVIMFTCVPMITIDLKTIKFDIPASESCGYSIIQPDKTGFAPLANEIGTKTANVPIWWYLVHVVSKGITNASTAIIPCQPDLRQIRFEVQHTRIDNPQLAQEIAQFMSDCYAPSRARLSMSNIELDRDEFDDIAWIGSRYFLYLPGFYDRDRSTSPRSSWEYNSTRDAGLLNTGNGGYPSCKQWWLDKTIGLKDRVLKIVSPSLWLKVRSIVQSDDEYEESILKTLVSPRNIEQSQGGRVYPGYGGNADFTLGNATTRLAASVGNVFTSLTAYPSFDAMRQALPMVQAILLMALVICLPFIIVFSAYDLQAIITITFVQFAMIFTTFWWELARWLDAWLLKTLYLSDSHSLLNWNGIQNSTDDLILPLLIGSMFVLLPAFWIGALGWAGIKAGHAVQTFAQQGSSEAKKAGGSAVQKVISKL